MGIRDRFEARPASEIYALAAAADDYASLRVRLSGESLEGDLVDARYLLPLGTAGADGETRLLDGAGIEFRDEDGRFYVDNLNFGGPAEQLKIDFDWEVVEIDVAAQRPPQEIFYIPALLLLAGIWGIQRRRKAKEDAMLEAVPAEQAPREGPGTSQKAGEQK